MGRGNPEPWNTIESEIPPDIASFRKRKHPPQQSKPLLLGNNNNNKQSSPDYLQPAAPQLTFRRRPWEQLRGTGGFRELSLRAESWRKEASEEKFFSAHRLRRGRRKLWFLRFSGRGKNHWAGQGRAGRLESRGRGSYFTLEPRLPRQLWLTGVYMCIRRRKLTNKSLLCVPQLYVVWSKYPHVCTDRKYNGILSLTLSSNSK